MTIDVKDITMRATTGGVLTQIGSADLDQSVIYDGLTIPFDSILMFDHGQHTGPDASTNLVDSTESWATNENQGLILRNTSDRSQGPVTSNTATEVFATMSGGFNNDFDQYDHYELIADIAGSDIIEYDGTSNLSGSVSIDVKGVPVITGVSGTHTFNWRVYDVSTDTYTSTVLCTVTV